MKSMVSSLLKFAMTSPLYHEISLSLLSLLIFSIILKKIHSKKSKKSTKSDDESHPIYQQENRRVCPLHEYEVKHVVFEASVSTITWFEGDAVTAASYIRARTKDILRLNPWLAGKLVKEPSLSIAFEEPEDDHEIDSLVDTIFLFYEHKPKGRRLSLAMHQSDLADIALELGFICKTGSEILKKRLSFFKVTIIRDEAQPNQRFALIMSLAHRVGDGYTFYSIYNMLSSSTPLCALDPSRKNDAFNQIEEVTRKKLLDNSVGIWLGLRLAVSTLWAKVMNRQPKLVTFLIDPDYLSRRKMEAKTSGPSILSSNDIITSTCFKLGKCDIGFMAVNFRGRATSCKSTYAGNYISAIKYAPCDYESPSMIRNSIKGPYYESSPASGRALFGPSCLLKCPRLTSCSNWSGFVVDEFLLPGSKQIVHLPLRVRSQYPGASFINYFIVFKPWRGQLGMMICGNPDIISFFESSDLVLKSGSEYFVINK